MERFSWVLSLFGFFDPILKGIDSFVIIIEEVDFRCIRGLLEGEIFGQETEDTSVNSRFM